MVLYLTFSNRCNIFLIVERYSHIELSWVVGDRDISHFLYSLTHSPTHPLTHPPTHSRKPIPFFSNTKQIYKQKMIILTFWRILVLRRCMWRWATWCSHSITSNKLWWVCEWGSNDTRWNDSFLIHSLTYSLMLCSINQLTFLLTNSHSHI
jgi:hypothetical protein